MMHLFEEYAIRNSIYIDPIRFVKKGFVFFGEKNHLLVIKWIQRGPGPGLYEISECALESSIKTIKVNDVNWEDYCFFLKEWSKQNGIVTDKKKVFHLTWEYFIRKNENFLLENYSVEDIFATIDNNNENRILDSFSFLDKLAEHKFIFDFWNNKLTEVISLYCYWIAKLV